jgi:hypothetical protein
MTAIRDELEGKIICLDLTPQMAMQELHIASNKDREQLQSCKSCSNMAYPFVDVSSFHSALELREILEDVAISPEEEAIFNAT